MQVRLPVRSYAVRQDEDKKRSWGFPPPPRCCVTAQTLQPGHDHTEQQQKKQKNKKNLNTAHSESI